MADKYKIDDEAMSKLTKVSMNLTEKDIANTVKLKNRLHTRSNADTVSAALSITSSLSEHLAEGETLLIRTKDGKTERVVIPGLN
jgi:hypothetical protein